jgi:hypothetical protein
VRCFSESRHLLEYATKKPKGGKMNKKIIAFATIVGICLISAAHAIKLCQLDWFNAWQEESGTLSNSTFAYTRTYGSQSETGTWSVTSDQGSSGVKHTVSGISMCGSSTSSGISQSATLADNRNCWCRMTIPNLGDSWEFVRGLPTGDCASYCAHLCADCVQNGVLYSCTRSAVLTLP